MPSGVPGAAFNLKRGLGSCGGTTLIAGIAGLAQSPPPHSTHRSWCTPVNLVPSSTLEAANWSMLPIAYAACNEM